MKRIQQILICLSIVFSLSSYTQLKAQDDYKYEIGGMLGSSFYMGDTNKMKPFKNSSIAGGAVFRYKMDLNWAIKTNLAVGHISGDTRGSGNAFPGGKQTRFSRNVYDLGGQLEYNFFSYSDQFQYLGTKKITPYVFVGLGMTYGSGEKSYFGLNVPFGLGVKYKLADRLNIGLEFSMRKLFGDSLDVTQKKNDLSLDNPYGISSSFMKNKDWYGLTMFSITWDFGLRRCPCLNID